MNHLLAIAKISEVLGDYADDSIINFWERRVRRSDEPEKVIQNLRKAVKAAKEFSNWTSSLPGDKSNLSWHESANWSHLIFWGHLPGKLEEMKKDFLVEYEEDLERQEALFKDWVKNKRELEARTFYN